MNVVRTANTRAVTRAPTIASVLRTVTSVAEYEYHAGAEPEPLVVFDGAPLLIDRNGQ